MPVILCRYSLAWYFMTPCLDLVIATSSASFRPHASPLLNPAALAICVDTETWDSASASSSPAARSSSTALAGAGLQLVGAPLRPPRVAQRATSFGAAYGATPTGQSYAGRLGEDLAGMPHH